MITRCNHKFIIKKGCSLALDKGKGLLPLLTQKIRVYAMKDHRVNALIDYLFLILSKLLLLLLFLLNLY